MTNEHGLSRRGVLVGGAAGAGALVLGGCSSDKKKTTTSTGSNDTSPSPSPDPAGGGASLAKVSAIPVGGSVAGTADGKPILMSQPTAGKVVAFRAICTHKGCTVAPAGKEFHCPCHGSIYDAATGAVKGGPAPAPLPSVPVHVANGEVIAGA